MTDPLEVLERGAEEWNRWRAENPGTRVPLGYAMLEGRDLRGYDFRNTGFLAVRLAGADLSHCLFENARLQDCDLSGAKVEGARLGASFARSRLDGIDFTGADLRGADFGYASVVQSSFRNLDLAGMNFTDAECWKADFSGATLTGATFQRAKCAEAQFTGARMAGADFLSAVLHMANLDDADLTGANLLTAQLILADARRTNFTGADLGMANIVNSNLSGATLVGTKIYGLAAWNVELEGATQDDLVITRGGESVITCDDVEIAQFIHLLLENAKVRKVIDNVTSKVVLILGRFSEERKAVLDAVRTALRQLDKTPILFDFDKPASKDIIGTVETLARMARFIIADITDPRSVPLELAYVVRDLPNTPVLPLLLEGDTEFSMFDDLRRRHPWVLETQRYRDAASLTVALPALIAPADALAEKLRTPA
ncbi:MAG TPA: pentapeptide repeat-containing protein [Thermoanaerobaculia bacterium]|nr:pentapeptide repeat-containing protein [Thermoanaerobaculia bacterium]